MRALLFIIKNDLFDQRVYNVLTENLTVNDIIKFIRQHIAKFDIEYVDAEIMNQLSYEVSSQRFSDQGFEFTGSIEKSIKETIELLRPTGNNNVK